MVYFVRGWQYRDGLCFLWHQDLKRLANMGGETGVMRIMNAGDEDVCCCDCGRIAHPTRHRFGPNTSFCKQHGASALNTKNFEIGHVCGSLPMALEAHCQIFHFCNCFKLLCWCSFGVLQAGVQRRARHRDDPDDAQLESSCEGKLGTLKANTFGCNLFEHVCVMFCVLCSALPRQSAQEKDCGARPLESTWTAWPFTC